jgi:hypothetical protein
MKIILTETQLKKILEQKSIDIVSVLKQMGFVPSGYSIFKHSEKPELTITLGGDILIIKLDGNEIAKVNKTDIQDLEGTIKSSM